MLGGWGRSPGSSGSVPPSGQRTGHRLLPLPFNRTGGGSGSGGSGGRAAEAEDVMGHYGRNKGGVNKIRTGLYYSPPGTSYTILEKPPAASPPPPPPRATYLRESSAGVSVSNHPGKYKIRIYFIYFRYQTKVRKPINRINYFLMEKFDFNTSGKNNCYTNVLHFQIFICHVLKSKK